MGDPPYGTIASSQSWDKVPDLARMWVEFKRVLSPSGTVVLTAAQPFTTDLIISNRDMFKYTWVWEKSRPGNIMNCHNAPLRAHEDVCVFSWGSTANGAKSMMRYYPQGLVPCGKPVKNTSYSSAETASFRVPRPSHHDYVQEWTNYPKSILRVPNDTKTIVATQKPLALMEYLINTYTLPGDLVADPFSGSGSTALACANTGRRFIGCERDPAIHARSMQRLEQHGVACGV